MVDEFDKITKIKYHYRFDAFLMYLIQDVTKRPSAEILNFFNELSTQVAEIGVDKMHEGQRAIDKKIDDYFPGTSIPIHMRVTGYRNRRQEEQPVSCEVTVSFPTRTAPIPEKDLQLAATMLMEHHLLGGEMPDVLPFTRPDIKSQRMFKDLMNTFMGRPSTKRKKSAE